VPFTVFIIPVEHVRGMAREQGTTRREYLRLAVVGGGANLAGCSDLESALGGDGNASTDDGGGLFGTETATDAGTEAGAGATPTPAEVETETAAGRLDGGGSGACTEPSGTPRELLPPEAGPLTRESVRDTQAGVEGLESGVSATYAADGEEYNVAIERYGSEDQATRRFETVARLISSNSDGTAVGTRAGSYVFFVGGPPDREGRVREFAAASPGISRSCATDLELLAEAEPATGTETPTPEGGGSGPCAEPTGAPEEVLASDAERFARQTVDDVDASADGFQSGAVSRYAGPDGEYIMAVELYESGNQATRRLRTLKAALSQSQGDLTAVGTVAGRYPVFAFTPVGGESRLRELAATSPEVSQSCAADGLDLLVEP
jgi:hypothetical protein